MERILLFGTTPRQTLECGDNSKGSFGYVWLLERPGFGGKAQSTVNLLFGTWADLAGLAQVDHEQMILAGFGDFV
jgi:hypothetical protein